MSLENKLILVTGGAVRIGKAMALALTDAGAEVVIHYGRSEGAAQETLQEITGRGGKAHLLQADLNDPSQASSIIEQCSRYGCLYALVNNAAIFENLTLRDTGLEEWERHLRVNLTAPFLLAREFARALGDEHGRIVNILDWRALRPSADHFPYTISKAGLAALTHSLAVALAPNITVNGLAFGAILPPSDGADVSGILQDVPAERWAELDEVTRSLLFLLDGPAYITGEIIHLDGGRHLV
jgi:NAD(P)-dependent dehydrogenase (short-subunit alcohol dehydrogenase family)